MFFRGLGCGGFPSLVQLGLVGSSKQGTATDWNVAMHVFSQALLQLAANCSPSGLAKLKIDNKDFTLASLHQLTPAFERGALPCLTRLSANGD